MHKVGGLRLLLLKMLMLTDTFLLYTIGYVFSIVFVIDIFCSNVKLFFLNKILKTNE